MRRSLSLAWRTAQRRSNAFLLPLYEQNRGKVPDALFGLLEAMRGDRLGYQVDSLHAFAAEPPAVRYATAQTRKP